MQVLVKTPHTDIRISGKISDSILTALKNEYGETLRIYDDEDETVEITGTAWFRGITLAPGDALRIYRQNAGLTQSRLGEALGGIPRQHISNMEKGSRVISLDMAKRLSVVLQVPAARFLGI